MPVRNAEAVWEGNFRDGAGNVKLGSGAYEGPYSAASRFEEGDGTNPEELIAAAHAGCFAMQLSHFLAENGTTADKLEVSAAVTLIPGTGITESALTLVATVPGIDDAKFQELAAKAKAGCPVSGALGAINITLDARLA